jgi:molybdopterin-containing oxidoreductase family iron-sulfur binding subunit
VLEVQRKPGVGLRVLSGTVTSRRWQARFAPCWAVPQAIWYQYDPSGRDNVRTGAQLAFGEMLGPATASDRAEVVLSLTTLRLSGAAAALREFAAAPGSGGQGNESPLCG